jgi:hypothetical protein
MEKQTYETPTIEVIELDTAPQILAGSPPPYGRDYDGEGR